MDNLDKAPDGFPGCLFLLNRQRAIEWGLALGILIALVIMSLPGAGDDFSAVLREAVRGERSYINDLPNCRKFLYPIWNVHLLRLVAKFPREVGLVIVWLLSLGAALKLPKYWGTPSWVVLISPPFLCGLFWGQPFEALALVGMTLILHGRPGLGVCFLMFKPQLAIVPALYVAVTSWRSLLPAAGFAYIVTLIDWLRFRQLWTGVWWQAINGACLPGNVSLWPWIGPLAFLWVPIVLWLLFNWANGNARRGLWLAMACGILLSPYLGTYSLWPLVAMTGCWKEGDDG